MDVHDTIYVHALVENFFVIVAFLINHVYTTHPFPLASVLRFFLQSPYPCQTNLQ